MTRERVSWRDRYPEEVTCVRCLEVYDQMHLDRMLWCDACRSFRRQTLLLREAMRRYRA